MALESRYAKRVATGKCARCGKPSSDGYHCSACAEAQRVRHRTRRAEAAAKGLCTECARRPKRADGRMCEDCTSYHQNIVRQVKKTVIDHYGGVCECCREANICFLTIDHINENGAEHRRQEAGGAGYRTYRWLIKNNFPTGFRVLCFNCNCAAYQNGGVCPHQTANLLEVAHGA